VHARRPELTGVNSRRPQRPAANAGQIRRSL